VFPCAYRGKLDAGKGAFLEHASPDRPAEHMTEKRQVMHDGVWHEVLRSKVGHRLFKDGRGDGMQDLPCQSGCPPAPLVMLLGDGRGLLATGGSVVRSLATTADANSCPPFWYRSGKHRPVFCFCLAFSEKSRATVLVEKLPNRRSLPSC
jgi:hypothetical protein